MLCELKSYSLFIINYKFNIKFLAKTCNCLLTKNSDLLHYDVATPPNFPFELKFPVSLLYFWKFQSAYQFKRFFMNLMRKESYVLNFYKVI